MLRHGFRLLALLLVGLTSVPTLKGDEAQDKLTADAMKVFATHCKACHHGPGSSGGFDVRDPKTLLGTSENYEKPFIVPKKPDESFIYQRIIKGDMPPRSKKELALVKEEIETVKNWIERGAPLPAVVVEAKRENVNMLVAMKAMRDYLRVADEETRPFLRFFTLTNLHNNPRFSNADLNLTRAALSKTLNSLSWQPDMVLPSPIDKDRTVLVIDVRDLDWDRFDLWRELTRVYPYSLTYENSKDTERQTVLKEIQQLTGTERKGLPFVRADWFIDTATRPPLYHTLLYDQALPELLKRDFKKGNDNPRGMKATDLELFLGARVTQNFNRDKLARAGFQVSGISEQNRLVERHRVLTGAYWKSYDFSQGKAKGQLTQFPLGPVFDGNEFNRTLAFEQDGGEIIYNLPNGLQGYLVVNNKEERLNAAPTNVVHDDSNLARDENKIVNGLSCIACHSQGMKELPADTVRAQTLVTGNRERFKVNHLYPLPQDMTALVNKDRKRFLTALEAAMGPYIKSGSDKEKPAKDFPEPVVTLSHRYQERLDLVAVACEVDEDPNKLQAQLPGNTRALAIFNGDTISRKDWEGGKFRSKMQEFALELNLGVPRSD